MHVKHETEESKNR